jgi:hypothetical protein
LSCALLVSPGLSWYLLVYRWAQGIRRISLPMVPQVLEIYMNSQSVLVPGGASQLCDKKSIKNGRAGSRKPILGAASRPENANFGSFGCESAQRCPFWVTGRFKDVHSNYESARGYPFWVADRQLDCKRASSLQFGVPMGSFWLCKWGPRASNPSS